MHFKSVSMLWDILPLEIEEVRSAYRIEA